MRRFVEGVDRSQTSLFPESLEDWVSENNPVRVIDAFVDALDLRTLGFDGVMPEATGRPSYHPAVLLKLYIYGYLNRGAVEPQTGARGRPQCRADVAHRGSVALTSRGTTNSVLDPSDDYYILWLDRLMQQSP
jgi:hypothetical protein